MATARKLPSGSWRIRVFDYIDDAGKKVYKSFTCDDPSSKGKKKAELMAAEYSAKKELTKKTETNNSFADELESYITQKEAVLSPSTIRGYKNIQTQLSKNYSDFYMKKISGITQNDVQKIINDLTKKKSPKTVRNYHGLISAVLLPHMRLNTSMPQKVHPDLYIPSDAEIKALMAAVKDTELEIPVMLGAFCMMRRGEICALDINKDIKGDVIHINKSLVLGTDKEWHVQPPKTVSSDRFIKAPEFVIKRIHEIGHITTYNPHSLTISFERILKKNNITPFRFHDLRHYSASIRHALGIPDAYIMADGGWSSDKVLKAVYRHAMNDRKEEMSKKANDYFSSF